MKKMMTLFAAIVASVMLFAQNTELPISKCGDTSWGNATISGSTITFPSAWDCGIGWWIGGEDWSAYNAVVLEYEAYSDQVALNVEYGTESESKGIQQAIAQAGTTKVRVALDDRKVAVQKVFIQAAKMGKLTLKSCYLEGGADPYDTKGLTPTKVNLVEGDGCYFLFAEEVDKYSEASVFEFEFNVTNPSCLTGWGFAKLVAIGDWENNKNQLNNDHDGVGSCKIKFLGSELREIGYKGGSTWYTDPDNGQGLGISYWDAEVVGCVVYVKGEGPKPQAIDEIQAADKAIKTMVNGQMVIIKNGVMYNMLGAAL